MRPQWIADTLAYARSLKIPLWNADQWYTFTSTRHNADYTDISWDGNSTLKFMLQASSTDNVNLTTILPVIYNRKNAVLVICRWKAGSLHDSKYTGRK